MIKVRIHGTKEELARFLEWLKDKNDVKVLSCSSPYADRGASVYKRVYLDVQINENKGGVE